MQRAHQVGADEAAGAEDEDRPLEPADLLGERRPRAVGASSGIVRRPRRSRNWTIDVGVEAALAAVELLRAVPARDVALGRPRDEPVGRPGRPPAGGRRSSGRRPPGRRAPRRRAAAATGRGRPGTPRGARPSGSSLSSQSAGRRASSSCRTASQIPPTSGPVDQDHPARARPAAAARGRRRERDAPSAPRRGPAAGRPGASTSNRRSIMAAQVAVERRHVGAQVRQAEQGPVVLQGVVRRPHHAVAVAAAVADQHDRQAVQADVVADLLERPGVDERRDAVDPGPQPAAGQPGGRPRPCSARPRRVDEPLAQRVAQRLQGLEAEVAGQEHELRAAGGALRVTGRRRFACALDLPDGLVVLRLGQRQVVPLHPVFHERDAAPLARPGHDRVGPGPSSARAPADRVAVVAVDLAASARRRPGTSRPAARGRRPRGSCRTPAGRSGRPRSSGSPAGGAGRRSAPPSTSPRSTRRRTSGSRPGPARPCSRLARARPAASESPCPRLPVANRMSSIPDVGGWPLSRVPSLWNCRRSSSVEPAERPERDVEAPGRVPLREHELVVRPEDVVVQDQHQVEAREVAADVADAALVVHPEQPQARPCGAGRAHDSDNSCMAELQSFDETMDVPLEAGHGPCRRRIEELQAGRIVTRPQRRSRSLSNSPHMMCDAEENCYRGRNAFRAGSIKEPRCGAP